jgi:hypothetical protein
VLPALGVDGLHVSSESEGAQVEKMSVNEDFHLAAVHEAEGMPG